MAYQRIALTTGRIRDHSYNTAMVVHAENMNQQPLSADRARKYMHVLAHAGERRIEQGQNFLVR